MVTPRASSLLLLALAVGLLIPPPSARATNLPVGATVTPGTSPISDPFSINPTVAYLDGGVSYADKSANTVSEYGLLLSTASRDSNGTVTLTYRMDVGVGLPPPIPGGPTYLFPGIEGSTLVIPDPFPAASVDIAVLARPAGTLLPVPSASRTDTDIRLQGLTNSDRTLAFENTQTFVLTTTSSDFYQGEVTFLVGSGADAHAIQVAALLPVTTGAPGVPEPASLALLPLSIVTLATRLRRRCH
jgi:hypothetical protein